MARIVRTRTTKADASGMVRGEVWVECYLPFDPAAFLAWEAHVDSFGGDLEAAGAADPALLERALAPIDSHGEAMLAEDVVLLAERFLDESRRIDVMHDTKTRPTVKIAQSFVNDEEIASPLYFPGAWVAKLTIEAGSAEWKLVEDNVLRAVSFAAYVSKLRIPVRAILDSSEA